MDEASNPFKALRERARLTQSAVASNAGFSRNFIIRVEQGTYPTVSRRLLAYYRDVLNGTDLYDHLSYNTVSAAYAEFQTHHRRKSYRERLLVTPFSYSEYMYELLAHKELAPHPFKYWRKQTNSSLTEIARGFCVHQAILHKWEMQSYMVHTVPSDLITALKQAGYPNDDLNALHVAYMNYRAITSNTSVGDSIRNSAVRDSA